MLDLSRESVTSAPDKFYHRGHLFKCQQIVEDGLFSHLRRGNLEVQAAGPASSQAEKDGDEGCAVASNDPSLRSLFPFSGHHGMNGGLVPLFNPPFIYSPFSPQEQRKEGAAV